MQQHRRDRKRASRRGTERDEAHVLDAVVGEHPLVVALGDEQRCGDEERAEPDDDEQRPAVADAERAVGDRLEAQQRVERDGEQHPGHQRGDRRGRLAVRVGEPAVHRREPDLGAVAEDEERHREAHDARVEVARGRHQRRPVEDAGPVRLRADDPSRGRPGGGRRSRRARCPRTRARCRPSR